MPRDRRGLYMVLTSADVTVGQKKKGFCSSYCGWHTYQGYGKYKIKFGFAGNGAKQCPRTTCNLSISQTRRT